MVQHGRMGDGDNGGDGDDSLDRQDQSDAIRFVARRALIWFFPMVGVGILLVLLGLPAWLVAIAVLIAYGIVVFELDL